LDAPLDESNINRFIRILQRFLEHSQFIIITHNKRTIGMASVLYGVTMEEQGVSKIVSVKFHKADETAPTRSTTPAEQASNGNGIASDYANGNGNGNGGGNGNGAQGTNRLEPAGERVEVVMAK
jgi:chromosome segregation protein